MFYERKQRFVQAKYMDGTRERGAEIVRWVEGLGRYRKGDPDLEYVNIEFSKPKSHALTASGRVISWELSLNNIQGGGELSLKGGQWLVHEPGKGLFVLEDAAFKYQFREAKEAAARPS